MPILTVTEGGLDLEAGFYPATLVKVEQMPGEAVSQYTGEVEDYLRWYLDVDEAEEGREYWATSSCKLGKGAKAAKWIKSLGFELEPGTGFNTDDLHGTRVIAEVGYGADGKTLAFVNIGPERRKRPATAGAKPKRAPVADDEEEEEFV